MSSEEPTILEPDIAWRSTARRWAAVAVLVVFVVALAAALGAREGARAEAGPDVWRPDYDRGWAWLVQTQVDSHHPDERARAECRWWVDGDGTRLAGVRDRAAFVAGCDTAATMTRLEAP